MTPALRIEPRGRPRGALATLASAAVIGVAGALAAGCASDPDPKEKPPLPSPVVRDAIHDYVDRMREDLTTGKVRVMNAVLRLNDKEAKVFWPIYQDYEEELFELGEKFIETYQRFWTAQTGGTLDDATVGPLATERMDQEQRRLDLLRKYHGIIAKELSPLRAAQFVQVEHRFSTIVDLKIAAEIPIIGTPRAAPAK